VSTPRRPTEQDLQSDLLRLEAYRNQLAALLRQLQYLANSYQDHRRARETLEGLEAASSPVESLIPIGGDAFVRGTADRAAPVLMGLGAGVLAEMPRPKASELLAERLKQLEEARRGLETQIGELEGRIDALTQRVDAMSQGASGSGDVGGD
jgi:prefoldin alpha subunit